MSKPTNVGDDPNGKMPSGVPLEHDEIATGSDDAQADDGGLAPVDEDEDDPGMPLQGDPDNQAGTDSVDRDKFERERAEGEDTSEDRLE